MFSPSFLVALAGCILLLLRMYTTGAVEEHCYPRDRSRRRALPARRTCGPVPVQGALGVGLLREHAAQVGPLSLKREQHGAARSLFSYLLYDGTSF